MLKFVILKKTFNCKFLRIEIQRIWTRNNVKRTYNRRGPMIQEQVLPLQTVAWCKF